MPSDRGAEEEAEAALGLIELGLEDVEDDDNVEEEPAFAAAVVQSGVSIIRSCEDG